MRIALHVQRKGDEDIAYNGGDDANQTTPVFGVSAASVVVVVLREPITDMAWDLMNVRKG